MRRPNESIDAHFIFASPTDKSEPFYLNHYFEEYTKEYDSSLGSARAFATAKSDSVRAIAVSNFTTERVFDFGQEVQG